MAWVREEEMEFLKTTKSKPSAQRNLGPEENP
jgi:hypothetical protein